MFSLIKLIIWLTGVAVIGYYLLGHFGYEVNWNYYNERKSACEEKIEQCKKDLLTSGIKSGLDGIKEKCDLQCVDPDLLIRKSESSR